MAAAHWEEIGEEEGCEFDDFDVEQYLENYPDLQAAFGTDVEDEAVVDAATRHYIQTGYLEGRTYEDPDEEGPDEEGSNDGAPGGEGPEDEPLAGEASAVSAPLEVAASQEDFSF